MIQVVFFFHNFLQISLHKSFQFIFFFYNFTKIKIKHFECPKSKPTVLFSIYQNNTWTIRYLVDETIKPATTPFILKIVGCQGPPPLFMVLGIYNFGKPFISLSWLCAIQKKADITCAITNSGRKIQNCQ